MSERELCGKWMPLAKTTCVRAAGHARNCLSAAAYANLRVMRQRWKAEHHESVLAAKRRRYAANPEKGRERQRQWRAANPEKDKERQRRWRAANPLQVYLNNQHSRAVARVAKMEGIIGGQ